MLIKKLHIQEEEIIRKNSIRLNFFKLSQIHRSLIVHCSNFTIYVLPLLMISVFEVLRNDPVGKNMILGYYYNNPESIFSNKNSEETDIENITNYIYYNYLTTIVDIN